MNKLSIVMCSWKSPALLKSCISSIQKSTSVDYKIMVALNEGDQESCNYLAENNIDFIRLSKNYGTLSVDFLSTLVASEYWINVNDDMLFHPEWDKDLISIIESNGNCSASCHLVEPVGTNNPVVDVDNLGEVSNAYSSFILNVNSKKYIREKNIISYTHPIMVKTADYFKIGGYSHNFDMNWFPGYGLDDFFAYRLYKLYDWNFKCITSKDSCVYHGISQTNNKLDPKSKSRNNLDYFYHKTNMSIQQFRNKINIFSAI